MKAPLSILICLPLIVWLWKRDVRARPEFSKALWIPTIWLLVLASRPLSFWFGVGGYSSDLEGNAFDATLYVIEILASIYILTNRGFQWGSLTQRNIGIMLFYLFLLASLLWSPYPFVSFKRWLKDFGAIPVMLVILTEQNPVEAIKAVFARCGYVLFPLSLILLKYFPSIGRSFSHGDVMFTGVTGDKNALGAIALIFGLVLLGEAIQPNRPRDKAWFKGHRFTVLFTLAIGMYLLILSNSKTSLVCFIVGAMIVTGHKLPLLKGHPRRVVALFVVGVPLFLVAWTSGASDYVLGALHRDATLTQRTEIWQAVSDNPADPILGSGYMMYWDMHKSIQIAGHEAKARSAHNGYIETYLDGGVVELLFLAGMLLAVGVRAIREFLTGSQYGRLALGFFVVMLLYNLSESMYARRSPLWFAFLLFGLEFRGCLGWASLREVRPSEERWIDEPETVGAGHVYISSHTPVATIVGGLRTS